jgi:hypothetical protein
MISKNIRRIKPAYKINNPILQKGEFLNPFTGLAFSDELIKSYNEITVLINTATTRAEQISLETKLHAYVIDCVDLECERGLLRA